jgi:hypothetical protein
VLVRSPPTIVNHSDNLGGTSMALTFDRQPR